MKVRGQIVGSGQTIHTEIEFEGTIASVLVLTFETPAEAQAHKSNLTLKHTLPFYEEGVIQGCHVTLRRKNMS